MFVFYFFEEKNALVLVTIKQIKSIQNKTRRKESKNLGEGLSLTMRTLG